jgi:hypothetical protein
MPQFLCPQANRQIDKPESYCWSDGFIAEPIYNTGDFQIEANHFAGLFSRIAHYQADRSAP